MTLELAGLVRIGQGREAEIFAIDQRRVIKVARATAQFTTLCPSSAIVMRPG